MGLGIRIWLLLTFHLSSNVFSQNIVEHSFSITPRFVTKLPKQLNEASGLLMVHENFFWSHNDGGIPVLFGFDTTGTIQKTIYLNHINKGWEDLAMARDSMLYIGAFGNNGNNRKELKIYKLNLKKEDIPLNADIINYRYEDQYEFPPTVDKWNFDFDAFIWQHEKLYLISKNRTTPNTGFSKVYELTEHPGDQVATVIDSILLDKKNIAIDNWITGADISPDGKILALLYHNRIQLILNPIFGKLSQSKTITLNLNHYSHKAGICFNKSGNKLFMVDEIEFGIGGNLYEVDLIGIFAYLNDH